VEVPVPDAVEVPVPNAVPGTVAVAINWDHAASVALGATVDRLVVAESPSP
jgi:hypothetical protein